MFDVVFDVPAADPEDDRMFVDAVQRAGNVIVAADVSDTTDRQYAVMQWTEPFDALAQAVAGTGAVKLPIDPDGVVRRGDLTVEGRPGWHSRRAGRARQAPQAQSQANLGVLPRPRPRPWRRPRTSRQVPTRRRA